MQKIIITGNSEYARLVREYVDELEDFSVAGFSVDGAYIRESKIDGLPVIAFEEIQKFFPVDSVRLILAIGYQKLGKTRRDIYQRYSGLGYEFTNYIHPSAQIDKNCILGKGNIFFEGVLVQKRVRIGNGNLFWPRVIISHDDTIGNFNTFCGYTVISGFVKIEDCSFFGVSSVVKDKIAIAGYNLIGSCSYVNRSTSEEQVTLPPSGKTLNKIAELIAAMSL